MKKIFAYVGSQKGKESKTYTALQKVLDEVIKNDNGIVYEIITSNMVNINPCLSCNNCFNHGKCIQDEKDDMGKMKQKMMEADLIILGSPVYAHNVSGDMKIFIDRISYWLHLFKLVNKKSVTFSSSSSNGNMYVNNYLEKMLTEMGANNIGNIQYLYTEDQFDKNIVYYKKNILKSFLDNEMLTTKFQELEFQSLKKVIGGYDKSHFEYQYWEETGMFSCDSFQEFRLRNAI